MLVHIRVPVIKVPYLLCLLLKVACLQNMAKRTHDDVPRGRVRTGVVGGRVEAHWIEDHTLTLLCTNLDSCSRGLDAKVLRNIRAVG